jgi:hypothetical protein
MNWKKFLARHIQAKQQPSFISRLRVRRQAPSQKQSQADIWLSRSLLSYPKLELGISGAFVPKSCPAIDPKLISRIKAAYRIAIEGFTGTGDSVWTVFTERSHDIHEGLLAQSGERITELF